jgi:hypothetical protein
MIWPERVRVSITDLYKTLNLSAILCTNLTPCGMMFKTHKEAEIHCGRFVNLFVSCNSHPYTLFALKRELTDLILGYNPLPDFQRAQRWALTVDRALGRMNAEDLTNGFFKPFTEFEPAWQRIMPDRFKQDKERCHLMKWMMIYERCFFNFTIANDFNKEYSMNYKLKRRVCQGCL